MKTVALVLALVMVATVGFAEVSRVDGSDTQIKIMKEEVIEVKKLLQYRDQLETAIAEIDKAYTDKPRLQAKLDELNALIKEVEALGIVVEKVEVLPIAR